MKTELYVALAAAAFSSPALAQRTTENAVTEAEDAFGTSVGRETIGVYSASSVRGFSPTAAGNIRIDGLYFDQVWGLTPRVRRATAVRVGLSSLGFPFPAPTGIIDNQLRRPGTEPALSTYIFGNSLGSAGLELDASVPISETLSLGLGGSTSASRNASGSRSSELVGAASLAWRPSSDVEVIPFFIRSDVFDSEQAPIYIPAGAFVPPEDERPNFGGPDWADYRGTATNYGLGSSLAPASNWRVRLGLFHSRFDIASSFSNLYSGVERDGTVREQVIVADPPREQASTSGELRVTRSIADGDRLHVFHLSARGRERTGLFGGVARVSLGPTRYGRRVDVPRPNFTFSPQGQDLVRQWSAGLAYEGRWRNVGELSLGLQRTNYRKRVEQPGLAPDETESNPWLYNATLAAYLTPSLVVYGGYVSGLEESGVAPSNAVNRDEPLPAIRTTQKDVSLRWTLRPNLRLVASLFDVRKPYFSLDANNRFTLLGDVKHQGLELSLAGPLTPRLNIVTGAVFLRPRVTGEGVRLGRVGERPVGRSARTLQLNLDWRPSVLEGLSFDLGISHLSRRIATVDNLVSLPARTLVDLGTRYRLRHGETPLTLRISINNLFNENGFDIRSSGAYDIIAGRVATASLSVDF